MLVSHSDTESEIALGVCSLHLKSNALLLVSGQVDIRINMLCAIDISHRQHLYIDTLYYPQLGK